MHKLELRNDDAAIASDEAHERLRAMLAWADEKDQLNADDMVTVVFRGMIADTHHTELTFEVRADSSATDIKAAMEAAAAAERQGATDESPDEQR